MNSRMDYNIIYTHPHKPHHQQVNRKPPQVVFDPRVPPPCFNKQVRQQSTKPYKIPLKRNHENCTFDPRQVCNIPPPCKKEENHPTKPFRIPLKTNTGNGPQNGTFGPRQVPPPCKKEENHPMNTFRIPLKRDTARPNNLNNAKRPATTDAGCHPQKKVCFTAPPKENVIVPQLEITEEQIERQLRDINRAIFEKQHEIKMLEQGLMMAFQKASSSSSGSTKSKIPVYIPTKITRPL